jgi:hypothetical protein
MPGGPMPHDAADHVGPVPPDQAAGLIRRIAGPSGNQAIRARHYVLLSAAESVVVDFVDLATGL